MKADQIIAENNQQRVKLSPANKRYYERLILFMRGRSLLKDEVVLETSLLEILTDILQAQADGVSARQYYGQDPEQQANALLLALPNDIRGFVRLTATLIVELLGILTLSDLIQPDRPLDVGRLLLEVAAIVPLPFIILWLVGTQALKPSRKVNVMVYGGFAGALAVGLGVSYVHTSWHVSLSSPVVLTVAGLGLVAGIAWLIWRRPQVPGLLLGLYLLGQLGLMGLNRIPALRPVMTARLDLGSWNWLLLGLVVVVTGLVGWLIRKLGSPR